MDKTNRLIEDFSEEKLINIRYPAKQLTGSANLKNSPKGGFRDVIGSSPSFIYKTRAYLLRFMESGKPLSGSGEGV